MALTPRARPIRDALRRSHVLRSTVVAARHRGLHRDDIYIASYPRSGNTWIRFLLADLVLGEQVDFESIDALIPSVGNHRAALRLPNEGRLIKTHEQHRHEYKSGIYLVRDVRDVLISWYRVTRTDPNDISDLDAFVESFMTKQASPYGAWTDHVRSWQCACERGLQIAVYRFEDLRLDPSGCLTSIADFLGLGASEAQVKRALARNTPDAMRRLEEQSTDYLRRAVGYRSAGVRRGRVGGWRELLDERHMKVLGPALDLNNELGYPK